jgi:hypothetical protein
MIESDEEISKLFRPGSVVIRPERDPVLIAGKDSRGRYVADPRNGDRFYRIKTGHNDPRGQFYLRDNSGKVIRWGHFRATVLKNRTLVIFFQSLFEGSGRNNEPDPSAYDLGRIPTLYLANLELSHQRQGDHDTIFVDERRYWFERTKA